MAEGTETAGTGGTTIKLTAVDSAFKDDMTLITRVFLPKKTQPVLKDIREGIATLSTVDSITLLPKTRTNRFYLQNFQINKIEKISIIETFGKSSLYTFNEKAKYYSFSGIVLDTYSPSGKAAGVDGKYYWAQQLQVYYENYLRGGILKRNNQYGSLTLFGNVIYYGYPIQMIFSKTANEDNSQQFQTTWAVIKEVFNESTIKDNEKYIYRSTLDENIGNEQVKAFKELVDKYFINKETLISLETRQASILNNYEAFIDNNMDTDPEDEDFKRLDAAYTEALDKLTKDIEDLTQTMENQTKNILEQKKTLKLDVDTGTYKKILEWD